MRAPGGSAGRRPGHPLAGGLAISFMVVLAAASLLLGRYSETVKGLMDRRDERIVRIDQQAITGAAMVMVLVLIGGAAVELARGTRARRTPG